MWYGDGDCVVARERAGDEGADETAVEVGEETAVLLGDTVSSFTLGRIIWP